MEKNGKIINEVNGIYNSISVEDSLNTSASNEDYIFVQVFNQTDNKHQLKMIKSLDADEEMTYMSIKASDSDHIFEYIELITIFFSVKHYLSESQKIFLIHPNKIEEIDLNSEDVNNTIEILKLSQLEGSSYPVKICSDGSKLDPKQVRPLLTMFRLQ